MPIAIQLYQQKGDHNPVSETLLRFANLKLFADFDFAGFFGLGENLSHSLNHLSIVFFYFEKFCRFWVKYTKISSREN